MKAAVLDGNRKFVIKEIPMPETGDGIALVKVSEAGICGTDIHFWDLGEKYKGHVLGHEVVGTIVETGGREDISVGDRVMATAGEICGQCLYCETDRPNLCDGAICGIGYDKNGGFAEYIAVRNDVVFQIPEEIGDTAAAIMEPCLGTHHAVQMADLQPEDSVFIGGAGTMGALCAIWARAAGVSKIVISDINEQRLKTLKSLDIADEYFNAKDADYIKNLYAASGGDGFLKHIDCVGNGAAFNMNMRALQANADILYEGFPLENLSIDMNYFVLKEFRMKASYGFTFADALATMKALINEQINPQRLVTKSVKLDEIQSAFEELTSGTSRHIKMTCLLD